MADNRFSPSTVAVSRGETVRFELTNRGSVDHEALLGDAVAQQAHEAMAGGDSMAGMHHSDAVTVEPA